MFNKHEVDITNDDTSRNQARNNANNQLTTIKNRINNNNLQITFGKVETAEKEFILAKNVLIKNFATLPESIKNQLRNINSNSPLLSPNNLDNVFVAYTGQRPRGEVAPRIVDRTLQGRETQNERNNNLTDDLIFGGINEDGTTSNSNDTLRGASGNDFFIGGLGNDVHDGGNEEDTVSYLRSTSGVTVNLQTNTGSGGYADGDTYINIENIIGSNQNDTLDGNNQPNTLIGLSGEDNLLGGKGNDILLGGEGNDNLAGNEDNDFLNGENGSDTLIGGEGIDFLNGGEGIDFLNGGEGNFDVSIQSGSRDLFDVKIFEQDGERFVEISRKDISADPQRDRLKDNVEFILFDNKKLFSITTDPATGEPTLKESSEATILNLLPPIALEDSTTEALINGIPGILVEFQNVLNNQLKDLPIFGNTLASDNSIASAESTDSFALTTDETVFLASNALSALDSESIGTQFLNFIAEQLEEELERRFDQLEEVTDRELQNIFFEIFNDTLGILKDSNEDDEITVEDIDVEIGNGSTIKFDFALGDSYTFDTSLPKNIGLPWLGFDFGENASAGVTLDYEFDVGFGINEGGEFFFDTSPEKDLSVSLTPTFPETTATLGFLQVSAETTEETGAETTEETGIELALDLSYGNDDRVTLSELDSLDINPTGNAAIRLDIQTGLSDFGDDDNLLASLPQISTEFSLDWNFLEEGSTPNIQFNDVSLDLGTFFSEFAAPILESVQKVIGPIHPVLDRLTTPLPVIRTSLLDLAKNFNPGNVSDGTDELIQQISEVIGIVEQVIAITTFVDDLDVDDLDVQIDLGDFDLNLAGVDLDGINDLSDRNLTQMSNPEDLETQLNSFMNDEEMSDDEEISENERMLIDNASSFFTELDDFPGDSDNGLKFPILEDLSQAASLVNLFLGNEGSNIEFFSYQTPELGFDFNLGERLPPIPVFGPIVLNFGGSAGAGAQFRFGYDTEGLVKFAEEGFENPALIADGFFVSRPEDGGNNLFLDGFLSAEAAAEIGIGRVSAGGGVGLEVGLGVAEEINNEATGGKVRASNIANEPPLCLFDFGGSLYATIFASLKVGFGFFSFTKRFNLADINIIDFTIETCEKDINEYFDVENPEEISPKLREELAKQGIIERRGTDEGDTIEVFSRNNDLPQDLRLEGLDEDPVNYDDVNLIIFDGGAGNDEIALESDVRVNAQLEGGTGNDTITGGRGFDFLTGGAGNDVLDGGEGDEPNTAVYADAPEPNSGEEFAVIVDLNTGRAVKDGFGTADTLINIENVEGSRYADRLIGNDNANVLDGGDGNDSLVGNGGDDVFLTGMGIDTIDGGEGTDITTYLGSKSPVYINLSSLDFPAISPALGVSIFLPANQGSGGEAEGDVIISVEELQGSIYDDILVASDSGPGNIDGFEGNDIIFANSQADILVGGSGTDWLSYQLSDTGVSFSLSDRNGTGGYAQGDRIELARGIEDTEILDTSFENLEGSQFSDPQLQGDNGDNIIRGLGGDDVLEGEGGDDTLIGGAGADSFNGGNGTDLADYSESSAGVTVRLLGMGEGAEAEGDTFTKASENVATVENLLGSRYGDRLVGDDGDNRIDPSLSNNYFENSREEIDIVEGGGGVDTLVIDYSQQDWRALGIQGGFASDTATSGYLSRRNIDDNSVIQDAVSFSEIERSLIIGTLKDDSIQGGAGFDSLFASDGNDSLNGGDGNDSLRGEEGNDFLEGGNGNDAIQGNEGDDFLNGGNGNNVLQGNQGNDTVIGGDGNDWILGNEGNDTLEGGAGGDYLDGGDGRDMASYRNSFDEVFIALPDILFGADAEGDVLISIEDLQGSFGADVLIGNEEDNYLDGYFGDDWLEGGDGNDSLEGGDGDDNLIGVNSRSISGQSEVDTLTGGAGPDRFELGNQSRDYYDDLDPTNPGLNNYALITDFNPTQEDIIHLSLSCDYYRLEATTGNLPTGTAIYRSFPDELDELIAIVQGVGTNELDITASYFQFQTTDCDIDDIDDIDDIGLI